ncbi:hypothetical protein Tco_1555653 [Tanacetum coccineum]
MGWGGGGEVWRKLYAADEEGGGDLQTLSNLHYLSWSISGPENSTNESGICEMTVTFRDYGFWHAMPGDYFFDVPPCKGYILSVLGRVKCAVLVRRIRHAQFVSCPLMFGEVCGPKIHGYSFPLPHRESLVKTVAGWVLTFYLNSRTC